MVFVILREVAGSRVYGFCNYVQNDTRGSAEMTIYIAYLIGGLCGFALAAILAVGGRVD
jgi:hypothetical protein